ncbi:MAG: beta-galactosidase [Clostridia bacterium]|jgi:beta-galactosidase GanA
MIFGAQYYRPPFPAREHWADDMASMRRHGFNTVKIWAVWNWIETEPGHFDFSELRGLREAAQREGLNVVVNTIPEGAPAWALKGNEDALYRTARGEAIHFGGPANLPSAGWPGFCPDKPEAARLIERFVEAVAADCRDDPDVVAIDVWNEPHLEPMFDYRTELLCYCDHSRARFRTWLQARYGDLDSLNRTWFRRYKSWDEIEPPPRFGTWTDMIDWRRFCIDNLTRQLRGRVAAARRGAPELPVQTHVAYSAVLGNKLAGGLGNELGDEFSLAREVDVFGLSSFPKWLQQGAELKGTEQQRLDHAFVHLSHAEMVAEASRGRKFYQVELQGGGGKAGLLGGAVPDARDITVWNYNLAAAGGKGVLYWQWAAEPAGIESPGFGLVRFDGGPTPRSQAAARCAAELVDPRLERARRVLPVNGIYVSRKSQLICFAADRREDLYAGSLAGAYRAAYTAGLPVRFVHEDYVDKLTDEGLQVLYVPMALSLGSEEHAALHRFVEAGGVLVGEAAFGLYDATGLLDESTTALHELFGLEHREIDARTDSDAVLNTDAGFVGTLYRHLVEPRDGTTVLSRFSDGYPALTSRTIGRGRAVFAATFAALACHKGDDAASCSLASFFDPRGYHALRSLNISTGNETAVSPAGSGFMKAAPVVRLLETADEWGVVVVNHKAEQVRIELAFDSAAADPAPLVIEVPASSGIVRWVAKRNHQVLV